MLRTAFSLAAKSEGLRSIATTLPAARRVVDRFVAGETQEDGVETARKVRATGRQVTLDLLGEGVDSRAGAVKTRDGYLALLEAVSHLPDPGSLDVSLKPSALGLGVSHLGDHLALTLARDICSAADRIGATVTLDMEGSATVDATLELGNLLRVDHPTVGNVLQSNLRRTYQDLQPLAQPGVRIRIVKGAYKELDSVAFRKKSDVDAAFTADIETLFDSAAYPMIATHDAKAVEFAAQCAESSGRGPGGWEYQMLYGVAESVEVWALHRGLQVRLYLPFGSDWYEYFMRRLAERPANVTFFLRALVRA